MEKTEPAKAAVDGNKIVIACAYNGHVHESVTSALPQGFNARQYVAKFVGGELVAVEAGRPEEAIARLLGNATADCKSCEDETCTECEPVPIPSQ